MANTLLSKTITWTGKKGNRCEVTIELTEQTTKTVNADGVTVECDTHELEITHTGRFDGKVVGNYYRRANVQGMAALCGKLGIPAEQAELIDAVIAEAEAHPAMVAYTAKLEAAIEAEERYEAETDAINRKMGNR